MHDSLADWVKMQHQKLQFNFCVKCTDEEPRVLSSITRLKSQLPDLIEPDFGLLDHLLSLNVLTLKEVVNIRSEKTVYRRNTALLDHLTSGDQCDMFLKALQRTGQQHVANLITQNGGQRECSYSSVGKCSNCCWAVFETCLLNDINEHLSRDVEMPLLLAFSSVQVLGIVRFSSVWFKFLLASRKQGSRLVQFQFCSSSINCKV